MAPQVYTVSQVEVDSVVFETDEMMEGDERNEKDDEERGEHEHVEKPI